MRPGRTPEQRRVRPGLAPVRAVPIRRGRRAHRPAARQCAVLDLSGLPALAGRRRRSEEHTSELQSLMRLSYAVFCFQTKTIETKRYSVSNFHLSITFHV